MANNSCSNNNKDTNDNGTNSCNNSNDGDKYQNNLWNLQLLRTIAFCLQNAHQIQVVCNRSLLVRTRALEDTRAHTLPRPMLRTVPCIVPHRDTFPT